MTLSSWLCTNNARKMLVKIVLPGGRVQLHDRPILAAEIMLKYPRCCVTYPHVFRQPWAVVTPDTVLMLGHKFYVVPISTLRKLQRNHLKRSPSPRRQADLSGQNYVYQPIKHDGEDDGQDPSCWFFSGKNTPSSSYGCFGQSEHEMEECGSGQEESCFMCLIPRAKSIGVDGPSRNSMESKIGESPKRNSTSTAWQPSLARISEDETF